MSQSLKDSAFLVTVLLLALIVYRSMSGFFSPLPLQVDEAQYLGWSRDLAFGYYSKPPVIAWVLAANRAACDLIGLTGPNWIEGCARMSQAFALGFAGLFAGLTSWALFQNKSAALATPLLLLTSPLFGFLSLFATTDAWLLMFWSVGLWAFVKAISSNIELTPADRIHQRWGYWVACGLAVGLGLLAKYSMGIFVISAFFVLLIRRQLFSWGPWAAALTALLVFSPNLLWNATEGFPTLSHHLEISQILGESRPPWSPAGAFRSLAEFVGAQLLMLGPFAILAVVFWAPGALAVKGAPESKKTGLLLLFILPILLLMLAQAFITRAFANWAAPAYLAIAILVGRLWALEKTGSQGFRFGSTTYLKVSILFGLLFSLLCIHGLTYSYHRSDISKIRALEKLRGWKEAAEWIKQKSQERDAVIVADDRWLLANLKGVSGLTAYALDLNDRRNSHYSWFFNVRDHKFEPDQWILIALIGDAAPETDIRILQASGFRDVTPETDVFPREFRVGNASDKVRLIWARR